MSLLKSGEVRLSDAPVSSAPTTSTPLQSPPIAELAPSVVDAPTQPQVTIFFDGFTSDELALIFDYVPAFEGHIELGKSRLNGEQTELTLYSKSALVDLESNFSSLLLHLDLPGAIIAQGENIRLVRAD